MADFGLTQEECAERVGKSRPAVANALRLLGLPEPIQAMVEDGRLSAGHARTLVSVADPAIQQKIAEKVANDGLSVRQTEQLVKQLTRPVKEPVEEKKDPLAVDYAAVAAKELGDKLGRRVKIVTGKRKGRLELEYYGVDDLNDLLDALALLKSEGSNMPEYLPVGLELDGGKLRVSIWDGQKPGHFPRHFGIPGAGRRVRRSDRVGL